MAESININKGASKEEKYRQLLPQVEALIAVESDLIANLANVAAVLKETFDFFWVGFYLFKENELVLGPFQGPLACTRIQPGRGVCGRAFTQRASLLVPDVNQFEDHIACSSESQSEIVIPILKDNNVVAVLDVDSEFLRHFDTVDQLYLEKLAHLLNTKF
jgi:GAF domain-containing protein